MESRTAPPVPYRMMVEPLPEGPLDLDAFVPGEGPLELDIGFGRGRSLLVRAEAQPTHRVLGVECKAKWAYKVEEKRARLGLDNAKALCADVRDILKRGGPDGCLTRAFVHFPDPWWKQRHQKRMVVTDTLLDALARLLAVGGELFVQTDVEDRGHDYHAVIAAHPGFVPAGDGDGYWLAENPFEGRSNREMRAEEDGLPVFRMLARRVVSDPAVGG
ncbi:MAG: tRNA (guanosine(46)-N(7))-methyltransferase TrmB [Sandaracinaceae bacterium]